MSTRYVWEMCGVQAVFSESGSISAGSIIGSPYPGYPYYWTPGERCTFFALYDDGSLVCEEKPDCFVSPTGQKYNSFYLDQGGENTKSYTFVVPEAGGTVDITDWLESLPMPFFISPFLERGSTSVNRCTEARHANYKCIIKSVAASEGGKIYLAYDEEAGNGAYTNKFTGKSYTQEDNEVTYNDSVRGWFSSATENAVNNDSAYDTGTYYKFLGQDNIDPSACSIPSTINGGTAINITVTPGTGKVYGGTVSYIYQVSLAGGAWTTIATTTATSRSYTVPYGTASIQVRVQAKDNLGFTSATYVTSASVTVINNQPPTAPGSIDVTNVVAGQQATITLTAATDPDGTIASYIYERSVDGSAWQQIANVNSLTQTDTISADWGTVAYRACAVDDDGESGPYVTSETTTVNSGWVIISGPASDMGDKPAPFDFVFSVSVTGQASVDAINVAVTLDGENIYTGTPNSGVEVSIPIDTRLLAAGEHTVEVQATKESYLEANGSYTFDVPAITLPDGGMAEMLQNPEGDVVFPYTLARLVIGKGGKDLNELLEGLLSSAAKIQTGSYVGTGTHGQSNPNSLTFDFEPKAVFVLSNTGRWPTNNSGVLWVGQAGNANTSGPAFYVDGTTLYWYVADNGDADAQLNGANTKYFYTAIG